jgi:hypothetical protein
LYPSMSASALLKSRVARPSYLKKLAKAEDLIEHFPHNSWIVSLSKPYHCFFQWMPPIQFHAARSGLNDQ